MIYRFALCLIVSACSAYPTVNWPAGPTPARPALLPAAALMAGPAGQAEAQGAALATEAAALKVRAAGIVTD